MKINLIKYIEKFMCKYLGTEVLEGIVLTLLKDLVKRTGSKIDDKIYNVIFESISKEETTK